jgi:hypothetical protein
MRYEVIRYKYRTHARVPLSAEDLFLSRGAYDGRCISYADSRAERGCPWDTRDRLSQDVIGRYGRPELHMNRTSFTDPPSLVENSFPLPT